MARAELVDSWITCVTMDEIQSKIRSFFFRNNVMADQIGEKEMGGKQGSQLTTRLLGGWFVNPSNLPKRMSISFRPVEAGVRIEARIEEALGFGVLDRRLKKRYEGYFVQWMEELKKALPPTVYRITIDTDNTDCLTKEPTRNSLARPPHRDTSPRCKGVEGDLSFPSFNLQQ